MSTYLELQQRVANDYLNRTDFTNEVKRSLLAAIRFYERRRWRFNQTATDIAAVANQSFLTLPSNFLVLDTLRINAPQSMSLEERDLPYILDMRASSATGIPTDFTIYGNKIELAVIPDSAYSCPTYYLKRLPSLSADTDTNSWTTGVAQDVVAYHATKLMYAGVLRNDSEMMKFQGLEATALSSMVSEHEQYTLRKIKPTQF